MFDLLIEQRLSLAELARQESVSVPTPWRWSKKGVKNIRLETIQIGGRRYTSQEAFSRFVARTTQAAVNPQPVISAHTNRQRETAIRRAEARLAEAGI